MTNEVKRSSFRCLVIANEVKQSRIRRLGLLQRDTPFRSDTLKCHRERSEAISPLALGLLQRDTPFRSDRVNHI